MKTIPRELQNLNTNSAYLRELRKSLSLSELQKRILFGSLMGDGCLIVNSSQSNYRLQIEHSEAQKNYVFWKYEIFKNFVLAPPKFNPEKRSWSFRTLSHTEFSVYHHVFYRDGRKVLPEDIEFLSDPLTAAIWFMDDGGKLRKGCLLNIQNFTDGEATRIKNFFHSVLKIPATLHRNKKRFRLYIPVSRAGKWKNFLGSNLRKEFEYKIG